MGVQTLYPWMYRLIYNRCTDFTVANIGKSPSSAKESEDYLMGNLLVRQLDDLQVAERAPVNGEAHQRPRLVPALLAGGAGIDVQQA